MLLDYYLNTLNYHAMPSFLVKYLACPSLIRLKDIGYFCGMDYASKDIYNFRDLITRYDHSLTTALLIYKLTNDKTMTVSGLFHDISTPAFSHVIDYMNKDYEAQESTEEYTEYILKEDLYFKKCLEEDNINIDDIINFKKYPIVDNSRPKLCADRLDGVILTGIGWTKNVERKDINNIIEDLTIFTNEDNEYEIGFKSYDIAKKVIGVSKSIDIYCHSNEDNYMMELLAKITRLAINNNFITYNDLYSYPEAVLFNIFKNSNNNEMINLLHTFQTIQKEDIPEIKLDKVKVRALYPIVNGKRIK